MIEKIQFIPKDFKESLDGMPYESVGRLFMALIAFANDEDPTPILEDDVTAKVLYPVLKQQVIRWEDFRLSKVGNAKKGGALIGNQNATKNKQKQPKTTKNNQEQPTYTYTNTYTNNQIPNKDIYSRAECQEVMNYLNERTGKNLRLTDPNTRLISARLKEGYTLADFKCVIDKKCKKWLKDEKMKQYLKPSTLFAPSHFDDYLNEPVEEDKDDMLERWANSDETGVFADYTEVESSVPRLLG